MVATLKSYSTTGRARYAGDLTDPTKVWHDIHNDLITWLGDVCDMTLGTITPGSGYTDGVYQDVNMRRADLELTGGRHLRCTVTVLGGSVTDVTITRKGNGFKAGDILVPVDNTQVGGTGSGFQVEVASGDASIGLMYDPDHSTSDSWRGWLMGCERTDRYSFGSYFYTPSLTSTTFYFGQFYGHTTSTGNYNYGSWDTYYSSNMNMWGSGDGHTFYVAYSSDPDDRFFLVCDTQYPTSSWGWFETARAPGGNYPATAMVSRWGVIFGSSYMVSCNHDDGTAYLGARIFTPERPNDDLALFTGNPVYLRSVMVGQLPPSIGHGITSNRTQGLMTPFGTQEWNVVSDYHYARTV